MATKEDIKDALYQELKSIVSSETNVANPDDHVDILNNRGRDAVYPFIGFEVFGSPNNTGLHGNIHVDSTTHSGGTIDYVTYRRDTRLTVEIGIQADGDPHTKDQLYTATVDHFGEYIRGDESGLHNDVQRLRDGGFSDESLPDSGIHGDRQQYTLDYGRYWQFDDLVPMEDIEFSIEDLDEDVVYHSRDVTA